MAAIDWVLIYLAIGHLSLVLTLRAGGFSYLSVPFLVIGILWEILLWPLWVIFWVGATLYEWVAKGVSSVRRA